MIPWAGGEGRPRRKAQSRHGQNLLGLAILLAVLIILLVHVTVLPLYDVVHAPVRHRVLGDHEQSLCSTNLKPARVRWKQTCPRDGIVTVAQGGRLGNQMWEYASVWAVARRTGLEPFVPRCLRRVLDDVFAELSVPGMGAIAHCPVHWHDAARAPEHWSRVNQSIVLPRFVILPEIVLTWVSDVRREFQFRPKLASEAQKILYNAAGHRANVTFVGVHVRRTDYIYYLWRTRHVAVADESFYKQAMNYFRSRYHPVVFIIVSDDAAWCRERLSSDDAVVGSGGTSATGPSAGQDLATLAACNHSIIDYGTFGVWGAILAGGETIVYNITQHSSVRVAELLPQWQVVTWNNASAG